MRPRWQRAARAALAILLGLAALELGLRLAGRIYLARTQRTGADGGRSGPRIVCHGDSWAFGLWVEAGDDYPARLQRLFDADLGAAAPSIVNLGMPGLNTRMLRANLPRELARYRPELLLLTVGANNSWTWLSGANVYYDDPPWWEELRLVKLARLLLWRGRAQPADYDPSVELAQGEVAHVPNRAGGVLRLDPGGEKRDLPPDRVHATIVEDLRAVHALAEEHGTRLVLVAYGVEGGLYAPANRAMEAAAAELGVTLVHPEPALAAGALRFGFDHVYFEDLHPQALGYECLARAVHDALIELGLVEGAPVGELESADDAGLVLPVIRVAGRRDGAPGTPDEPTVVIEGGPPGRELRLLLWGAHAAGTAGSRIASEDELRRDPLYVACMGTDATRGRFDEHGSARLSLAWLPKGEDAGAIVMRAAYIVLGRAGGGWNRRSGGVEIELR